MARSRDDIMRELESAGESLANVECAHDEIKARITALRTELETHSPTARPTSARPSDISPPQTPAEKVSLFRSLFRGRADVVPVRFVSKKTGSAGYAPACSNKWLPELCHLKSGGKCMAAITIKRSFRSVTK